MSELAAKSPQASPRNTPVLSIRARLIAVALLALAPLMIERLRGLEQARAEYAELASGRVTDLAHGGVEAQRQTVNSIRAVLQVVARAYARMAPDQADCDQTLAGLASNIPWLLGLNVAAPDGRITCATDRRAIGLNVSDRSYFQNALRSPDFALSDYLISRVHQTPILVASLPVLKSDGSLNAVVFGSIDLHWISELAAAAARHEGTSVLMIDGAGILMAASADSGAIVGRNFADNALVREMLAKDEGTMTVAGPDGIPRIFSYVRVPWTQARLAVGLDERVVHSGVDRKLRIPTCSWRWSPC